MESELSSDYNVKESKITNHPEYSRQVLITRYGYAKRDRKTVWVKTEVHGIGESDGQTHNSSNEWNISGTRD